MGDLKLLLSDTNLSDSSWEYLSPSPTIPFLDHQEIVETLLSSTSPSFKPDSDGPEIRSTSTTISDLETDASQLFSFELDSNEPKFNFPTSLATTTASATTNYDMPDLTWSDILLDDSSDPVPLDDIFPIPLINHESNDQHQNPVPAFLASNPTKHDSKFPSAPRLSSDTHRIQMPSMNLDNEPSFYQRMRTQHLEDAFQLEYGNDDDGDELEADEEYHSSSDEMVYDLGPKFENKSVDGRHRPDHHRHQSSSISKACLHNEDIINGRPGQRIILTTEERKLLEQMNIQLPARFPLTRSEERALRAVRRKIRNKLSAQASRIKRQKYVVNLEEQLSMCNKENQKLRRQVADLQNDKKGLLNHLQNLRSYLTKVLNKQNVPNTPLPMYNPSPTKSDGTNNRNTTTTRKYFKPTAGGTSLLVITFMVLMWTSLVPIHQLALTARKTIISQNPKSNLLTLFPGRSRVLLSNNWNPLYYFMPVPIESNQSAPLDPYLDDNLSRSIEAVIPSSRVKSSDPTIEQHLDQRKKLGIDDPINVSSSRSTPETESFDLGVHPIDPPLLNAEIFMTE